jgi:hypothetical protein
LDLPAPGGYLRNQHMARTWMHQRHDEFLRCGISELLNQQQSITRVSSPDLQQGKPRVECADMQHEIFAPGHTGYPVLHSPAHDKIRTYHDRIGCIILRGRLTLRVL